MLRDHPDVVRVLSGVFDVSLLPNRAELRLKPSGKVIGYTIAHVRADGGDVIGVSMFFKDLTRVEQLEERERLRDRLAAVGEMAAASAHEVKNPLAGIEVMAGLLRRKIPDAKDTQAMLTDIINEAKMANAIVQEVLDFVRPMRLHVERTSIVEAVQASMSLADTKAPRTGTTVTLNLPPDLPMIQADPHQLTQLLTNLLTNAYEALGGAGPGRHHREARAGWRLCGLRRGAARGGVDRGVRRRSRNGERGGGADLRPLLHHEGTGVGARAGDRAEDCGRPRRASRPPDVAADRNGDHGDAARDHY